jgi:acyl carrier protein
MISWRRVAIGLSIGIPILIMLLFALGPSYPKSVPVLLIAVGVVATFIVQKKEDRRAKELVLKLFKGRKELDDESFGSTFLSQEAADCAVVLRSLFQPYFPLSLSRIHPTDAFVKDLQMNMFDSEALDIYVDDIEKAFQIKFSKGDASNILTFGQLVEYVVTKRSKLVD